MLILSGSLCLADGSGDPTPVKNDDGKYYDKDGNPTFNIAADGTVDWYTYSGYRRYNAEFDSTIFGKHSALFRMSVSLPRQKAITLTSASAGVMLLSL